MPLWNMEFLHRLINNLCAQDYKLEFFSFSVFGRPGFFVKRGRGNSRRVVFADLHYLENHGYALRVGLSKGSGKQIHYEHDTLWLNIAHVNRLLAQMEAGQYLKTRK